MCREFCHGLKGGSVAGHTNSTDGGTWHKIESIIPEILFKYTQIFIFLKSHHFGKCSHLIVLYIIGYDDISWRPHDLPITKPGKSSHPQPSQD